MVKRDYQAKLWSAIWPSAIETLDKLTDDQLDLVFSVRRWMQEEAGHDLLPFIGGSFKIYALTYEDSYYVYITLGQPRNGIGDAIEAIQSEVYVAIVFKGGEAFATQMIYGVNVPGRIEANNVDRTTLKSYSSKDVGNDKFTGQELEEEHQRSEARLAELNKPQEPVPAGYVNSGKVKLYDMTAPLCNESWFDRSIYDDANRLIIALEANPFYLNHLLHYMAAAGKWEGEFKAMDGLTEEEHKGWYSVSMPCDTHGHSGFSFNMVIANALWRVCGMKNVDGTLVEPAPDLVQLINVEQVLPGSLK